MRDQRDERHEAISSHLQPDGRKGRKIGRIRSGLSNIFERTSSRLQNPNKTEPIDIYLPPPIPTKEDKTPAPQSDEISTRSINETINEAKKAAQDQSTERRHARNIQRYRGFSTSLSSLFLDEQVVCGAIAWCGILASTRTEHFLNIRSERRRISMKKNEKFRKPSIALSMCLLVTIILFLSTFVIWGFGSGSNNDQYQYYENDDYYQRKLINHEAMNPRYHRSSPTSRINNYHSYLKEPRQLEDYSNDDQNSMTEEDMASAVRAIIFFGFFLFLGIVGRRRRMRTRYAVMKARTQNDRIYYTSGANDSMSINFEAEDQYDGACSHTLCGCYPKDRSMGDEAELENGEKDDFMNALFARVSSLCCGALCSNWLQCFSVCALAQEMREARLLVPPKLQRIDLITHQPFDEYFKDVYMLRRGWKGQGFDRTKTWRSHLRALSTLSRYILATFIISTVAIILTARFNPRASFSWGDASVILLTFLQSFIVLGVVHGIFHKSDLSLDAVIKFFAAGFLMATPTAFALEALVYIILSAIYLFFYMLISLIVGGVGDEGDFDVWFEQHYTAMMMASQLIQGFFVAAAVEEFTKYYTFRTIEHPDLIFLTGLDSKESNEGDLNGCIVGGQKAYPFSSSNASLSFRKTSPYESTYSISNRNRTRDHRGRSESRSRSRSRSRSVARSADSTRAEEDDHQNQSHSEENEEPDIRTVRQRAAAVTTAMISSAIGLSCAENFIYVFIGSNNTREEFVMLLLRSIFPIHALCAAMQSIGMNQKFLEKDEMATKVGVGKIVLPAIICHGSFDAVLLMINHYVNNSWEEYFQNGGEYYEGDVPYNAFLLNLIAASLSVGITILGLLYFMSEKKKQSARLKEIEIENEQEYWSHNIENGSGENPKSNETKTLELL